MIHWRQIVSCISLCAAVTFIAGRTDAGIQAAPEDSTAVLSWSPGARNGPVQHVGNLSEHPLPASAIPLSRLPADESFKTHPRNWQTQRGQILPARSILTDRHQHRRSLAVPLGPATLQHQQVRQNT